MSPEEANNLNQKVKLSGLSKQQYITDSLLQHEIRVVCGRKVAKEMQDLLEALLEELQYLEEESEFDIDVLEPLRNVLAIIEKDKEKS